MRVTPAPATIALLATLAVVPALGRGEEVVLHVNGSGSALQTLKPLARAFEVTHRGVHVELGRPLGSSGALAATVAGAVDLAVISRPVAPAEEARGIQGRAYGKTPLAVVVHEHVGKSAVTTRELEAIYSGAVRTWPGGEPVRIILRPENETNTALLRSLSPGVAKAEQLARRQPWAMVAVTDPEADELVVKTPGAIGLAALSSIVVERLAVQVLALDGVTPSPEALSAGKYPLAKPIIFATRGRPSPQAQAFLDFASSAEGRAIARSSGVLLAPADGASR